MRKLLVTAGLLALPFSANAILISVSVESIVASASGTGGPAVGDDISRTLVIDTDLLPLDLDPDPNRAAHADPSWLTDFVTGSTPLAANQFFDTVLVDNSFAFDRLAVLDKSFSTTFSGGPDYQVTVDYTLLDLIYHPSQFTGETLFQDFSGALQVYVESMHEVWNYTSDGFSYSSWFANGFGETSSVTVVQVTEPGTFLLLSGGLLAAGFLCRRRVTVARTTTRIA